MSGLLVSDKTMLKHPSSTIISGVSQSGKSVFCSRLIKYLDQVFSPVPQRLILSFTENQPIYAEMKHKNIQCVQGLDFDFENHDKVPTLIIIDDQMHDISRNIAVQDLFTKGVHHRNISLIIITQNLFNQGKYARDMRLNSHYLVIFKSPTFTSQVCTLSRQLFPSKHNFLVDAYKKATIKPYSYLFLNLHPMCEDELRVSTGILPDEEEIFFVPK